ncbi:f029c0d4-d97e-4464-a2da-c48ee1cba604 [Thermothielavioides terrestris]|uniref:Uncharacterized protein n=2 Tax=Thermothielavioides terrestris TaxID=2587410 RepID=G2QRD3_THETT|nr:uncharacterized protein THITE_2126568 [Thermothielavioides terrestris NRRL 8126]AEO64185.1 hypothetical protein THITE_2126568 [Thermothielavioides terrestris NRRL 8126]SPQ26960.1 f029c0d4-d97e-4464-a2da-c48ee1cba604 [Thermothielavioides terrestris]
MNFHLQTHPLHRPPLQPPIPEWQLDRATLVSSPSLPPAQGLRLQHLRRLFRDAPGRLASVRAAQEAAARAGDRLMLEEEAEWWRRRAKKRAASSAVDYSHSGLARSTTVEGRVAQKIAVLGNSSSSSSSKTLVSAAAALVGVKRKRDGGGGGGGGEGRDDDETATAAAEHRRQALAHHLARWRRLELAKQEIRTFERCGRGWWRREVQRLRRWIKERGAYRSRRQAEPRLGTALWARLCGLREAEEFDAHRWGEALRLRTVRGEMARDEWPTEECFRVYKWRRYGRLGEVPPAVGLGTSFASGEMWLRGPSPLGRG